MRSKNELLHEGALENLERTQVKFSFSFIRYQLTSDMVSSQNGGSFALRKVGDGDGTGFERGEIITT